jgi:hypothetical protein
LTPPNVRCFCFCCLCGGQNRLFYLEGYDDLNAELIADMPKLVADSENFFSPLGLFRLFSCFSFQDSEILLVALFIVNQAKFWQAMTSHVVILSQTAEYF